MTGYQSDDEAENRRLEREVYTAVGVLALLGSVTVRACWRRWRRRRAAAVALVLAALLAVSGCLSDAQLERLRWCEARGNYAAVSASGTYRGAYQFSRSTWRSVGGTGDPAAASPVEQDLRARLLYEQRGRSPWPVCGRRL